MNFISYEQLYKDLEEFVLKLPRFDAVIGIARSGLIPATYLSCHWNVPLGTVNTFGKFECSDRIPRQEIKNVLVVDDSYYHGKTMNLARDYLKNASFDCKYAAMYPVSDDNTLDYYYKAVHKPRAFQWNVFHHISTKYGCFDMDGVLCRKPTREENDYGKKYESFLESTEPLNIPTYKIGAIITGRIEKYREQTVEWLKRYNVEYEHLLMRPDRTYNIAEFKARLYSGTDSFLFFEDDINQAIYIAKRSGKEVLCTSNWRVIGDEHGNGK